MQLEGGSAIHRQLIPLKTTASLSLDAFQGLPEAQELQIPDIFPEKYGHFFPFRNPLYFRAINAFFSPFDALYDQLHVPFFAMKITRLNWPVFSRLKRPVFKNTDFYEEFCRALAAFPLEHSSIRSSPKTLRRRMDHGRGHVRPPPPFIKGVLPEGWSDTLPGVRVRVIVRPPPFDLGNRGRKDPEPSPGPLVLEC